LQVHGSDYGDTKAINITSEKVSKNISIHFKFMPQMDIYFAGNHATVPYRLARLNPFKRRLNSLNAKQSVAVRLAFTV